jgi:hypothetical protein
MNEPKINITVMPGAQMNGYVKEQHNYFGTVQQIVKAEEQKVSVDDAEAVGTSDIVEEPLHPGIFENRIFNSNERLTKLRDTIAAAIDMGNATIMYGKPQEVRINPTVQNEWYYIEKAIVEAGVAKSKLTDTLFVEQMVEWFPMLFPDETPEKFKDFKRRLLKSISAERGLWKSGKMKLEVTLKDMWAKGMSRVLGDTKANRIYELAYKGLYISLTALKHELERDNNQRGNGVK